jgi:signal transduction histidine kinase
VDADAETSVRQEFRDETVSTLLRRLPRGVIVFLTVFGLAALLELTAHPDRAALYGLIYAIETAVCLAALGLARWARTYSVAIVSAATVLLIGLVTTYHFVAQGEFEILVLAIGFILVGSAVWFPWGVRGQLPVLISAFCVALLAPTWPMQRLTPGLELLGLFALGGLTLVCAHTIDQDRLTFFRHAVELEKANGRLALANRTHTQFLANVSHELRTPLNAMLGYLDILNDGACGALPAEAKGCLDRIHANARLLLRLAGDFLDLSRLDADRLGLDLGDVEISTLCGELTDAARMQLQGKPVDLVSEVPSGLTVRADPDRLRQVIGNLLSNAIKFTERGTITVRGEKESDSMVRVSVADTGIGIAADELEAIFEPFHRGQHVAMIGGVGVGLALSRRLAEAMGGSISVESLPGEGSTFSVRLNASADPRT